MLDPAFLEAARRLVAADSVTEHGNLRAVELLEPLWQEAGLATVRLAAPDTPDRDANLLAGPGGGPRASGAPLLLVTHLDTVDPGPRELWKTDPFVFTVDGDRAYGMGVADVKLDALCKLWAARRLKGVALERPFYFLGTYGEEAGLRGAREFTKTAPFAPGFVFCGEPCSNRIHHAHKGYAMVRVTLTNPSPHAWVLPGPTRTDSFAGKAVHSSTPHLGVNAIDRALEALVGGREPIVGISGGSSPNTVPARCEVSFSSGEGTVEDLRPLVGPAKAVRDAWMREIALLAPAEDARFTPAGAVGNLTKISGRNGALELVMDARLLPAHDPEQLHRAFRRFVDAGVGDVHVGVEVLRNAAGMSVAEDAPVVRRAGSVLSRLGLDGRPVAKPTSTEGGVFTRWGAQALVFGPSPATSNAHTPNEHARLDEVERAIDVYEALIREFCRT